MSAPVKHVEVTTYVVIEPTIRRFAGEDHITGARAVAIRKDRPKLGQNQYAVKLRLKLPESLFLRFIPEARLEVLPDQVVQPEAQVVDPADGEGKP